MKTKLSLILFLLFACSTPGLAATYYVNSESGSDKNKGTAPHTAWKSLKKVNSTEMKPGDKILFARGGLWRGTLLPHSGAEGNPVYYGAYGEGELPKLYGSADASNPEDWTEVQPGIWSTKKIEPVVGEKFNWNTKGNSSVQGNGAWSRHEENGAQSTFSRTENGFKLKCKTSGTKSNHLQIWGPSVSGDLPESGIQIVFRARCSKPFPMSSLTIQKSNSPWDVFYFAPGTTEITPEWKENKIFLINKMSMKKEEEKAALCYHLALGGMPSDCTLEFEILDVRAASLDPSKILSCDVGNIIFNHGNYTKLHRCGIKKWKLEDCKKPGDYWYNANDQLVYLRFDGNPGKELDSIELALRKHIIEENNRHDIIYENLAVAYGAAHGFGGGSTKRITIRKCDIYYIGGGHQFTRPDGKPVRFGNGIEFWGNCDGNLVEENRLWEVYDAALTNQGRYDNELNTTYRKNLIWNSEYSFEYWNRGITENILFEDNICLDAGFGWAHDQRPDPNGAHLMFYGNKAETKNFVIRNNVFSESTEVCVRMDNDWRPGLTLEGNQYYQSEKPLFRWLIKDYYQKDELKKIADELGMEKTGFIKKYEKK
ncbi:MAG: hypothetical protein Q4G69_03695 [Planctomycetia bacterium]|nr:hypothetical protein [Planctomycetia bacterium]